MTKDTKKTDVGTTGHSWDGIEELNNPLPRWWVWVFYLTIAWGIWYTIAYPAWPGREGATEGYLGFSTRAQVAADIAAVDAANAPLLTELATADLSTVPQNADLNNFAVNGGAALFRANCSQCHGSGAAGAKGYPNLLDNDWLWGGSVDDIAFTITHGIRNEQSPESHWTEMPAFGDILSAAEITQVVAHVRQISGQDADADLANLGSTLFMDNCASCHGDAGEGNRDMGAPRLNDAIWLYGGDEATLVETVTNARFGVMPAWSDDYRAAGGLSAGEVAAVALYVHQLGGGE